MSEGIRALRISPGARGKVAGVVASFPSAWQGAVLDVGCRTRELETALAQKPVNYIGLDIRPPADVIADLDEGIPISGAAVRTVVALDVLEHTDRIHDALAELFRVSSRIVIVSLPNCYHFRIRWAHLRGKPISGKYGLPASPPADRHRWFFSFHEARQFCQTLAEKHGWMVAEERFGSGPKLSRIAAVVRRFPNLLAQTYFVVLLNPKGGPLTESITEQADVSLAH